MKFVIAAYGSRGDTEPCLAVAGELQRRGHDVLTAVTVPPELCAHVESEGLTVHPYGRHWQEMLDDDGFLQMMQNPVNAIPRATAFVAQTKTEKTTALTKLIRGADLMVAGMTEQELAANVAAQQHVSLAALHFFPASVLWQGSPARSSSGSADSRPPLEIQAYDEFCVPRLAATWTGVADRRPFVGALTLQLPTPVDVDALRWISAGTPAVYFGFGSMPITTPRDMVAVIDAACARVDIRALICLGPNYFEHPPESERVKVVREVSHAAVFPACRAVVHHGGAGTTAASLRAGVPELVLWSGLDQPIWAASVADLGVGFGRSFLESTLESLVADLRLVLQPRFAVRACEVAGHTTAPADSLRRAADLLEEAGGSGRRG